MIKHIWYFIRGLVIMVAGMGIAVGLTLLMERVVGLLPDVAFLIVIVPLIIVVIYSIYQLGKPIEEVNNGQ